MDYTDIQIFCDLCKTQNITTTAERLFLTQSAVTRRIQKLEKDLGITLFVRGKGKLGVDLTDYGEKFIPLAKQYLLLEESFRNLKYSAPRTQIIFGGIDSVTCYLLPGFFESYLATHPQSSLNLYTYNSWDVFQRLESGEIDVGITHINSTQARAEKKPFSYQNIDIMPLFTEPYVLLMPKSSQDQAVQSAVSPQELDLSHEVYAEFDMGLRKWHQQTWPEQRPRMYAMGSISLIIPQLLSRAESWSIVPLSVAKILCQRSPFVWRTIKGDLLPRRSCCLGINWDVGEGKAAAVRLFVQELRQFVEQSTLHQLETSLE